MSDGQDSTQSNNTDTASSPLRPGDTGGSSHTPSTFRFKAKSVHLTYRSHINLDALKSFFETFGTLQWYSIVHESSDSENNYDHTHAAVAWTRQLDRRGARIFDFQSIHPHVQKITGIAHARTIWNDYHAKAPIARIQSETAPASASETLRTIREFPTLFEACDHLGIEPRSVNDVKLLREDLKRPDKFEHPFPNATWTVFAPDNWRVLYIYGLTNTGKTLWALAQFANPLLVSHMDQLRQLTDDHDGIVFDDMSFKHMPREAIIHLLDWDLPRAIHCRYSPALIPKHTKKIFTSNYPWDRVFPDDDTGAIFRRITSIIHINGPTYVN